MNEPYRVGVRDAEVSFAAPMTDWAVSVLEAVEHKPREWRLTLPEGQTWPDDARRGQRIDLDVSWGTGTTTLSGRVRFRRRNVLVLDVGR